MLVGCRYSQIAKFMGPAWGPPGSYRTYMGPMLVPWTWLSGFSTWTNDCCSRIYMNLCRCIWGYIVMAHIPQNNSHVFAYIAAKPANPSWASGTYTSDFCLQDCPVRDENWFIRLTATTQLTDIQKSVLYMLIKIVLHNLCFGYKEIMDAKMKICLVCKTTGNNKIWWLCLVPTSTTRFDSEVGYRMTKM